jgi:hypothetical protein
MSFLRMLLTEPLRKVEIAELAFDWNGFAEMILSLIFY